MTGPAAKPELLFRRSGVPVVETNPGRANQDQREPLLSIESLRIGFENRSGVAREVVSEVSFALHAGQTLALVGESGCGKSVTAMSMLGLLPQPPARVRADAILFDSRDLRALDRRAMRDVRAREIGMIFQEPRGSLNPVFSIGEQLVESIRLVRKASRREAREIAVEALRAVELDDPGRILRSCPHELSGGMCQRVMIALALIARPRLLIADEPTTALDVTIQAKILDLLEARATSSGMAMLLITHDFGVVARMADVVAVMYAGHIVEFAPVETIFHDPRHPYTRALLQSIPGRTKRGERIAVMQDVMRDEWTRIDRERKGEDHQLWWPDRTDDDRRYELIEFERAHWIGCARSS